MTEEQLRILIAYIDTAVEAGHNLPYSRFALMNKLARLKEQLVESVLNNKPKE